MNIKHSRTLDRLEAMLNKIGGDDGLDLLLADKLVLVDPAKTKKGTKVPEPLFTFAGKFKVAGAKEFVAAKNYVVNTNENARVCISYLGDSFKKHLLQKTERDIAASDIKLSKLGRLQRDLPMSDEEPGTIAGLGGLTKAETSLCEFYETLAHKQAAGDFSWTVGYVRDDNNVLWAVDAFWGGGGWCVEADSVTRPFGWFTGDGFLSRWF